MRATLLAWMNSAIKSKAKNDMKVEFFNLKSKENKVLEIIFGIDQSGQIFLSIDEPPRSAATRMMDALLDGVVVAKHGDKACYPIHWIVENTLDLTPEEKTLAINTTLNSIHVIEAMKELKIEGFFDTTLKQ